MHDICKYLAYVLDSPSDKVPESPIDADEDDRVSTMSYGGPPSNIKGPTRDETREVLENIADCVGLGDDYIHLKKMSWTLTEWQDKSWVALYNYYIDEYNGVPGQPIIEAVRSLYKHKGKVPSKEEPEGEKKTAKKRTAAQITDCNFSINFFFS